MANFKFSKTATYELVSLREANPAVGPCCGEPLDEAEILVHEPGKKDYRIYLNIMQNFETDEDDINPEIGNEFSYGLTTVPFNFDGDWDDDYALAEYECSKDIFDTPIGDIARKLTKFFQGEE